MSFESFQSLISNPPKEGIYVVDTNFIINCSADDAIQNAKISKALRAALKDCVLVYNVVTKNELLHHLREFNLKQIFDGKTDLNLNESVLRAHNRAEGVAGYKGLSKWVLASGYGSILLEKFGLRGQLLFKQFNDLVDGFISSETFYKSGTSNASSWDNVFKIMAEHALDSSDAMILNFALSDEVFSGIISVDRDFNYCVIDDDDFKVILPSNYISDKTRNKTWKN
jgi:predicted nucleic acid-binding protein